MPGFWKSVFSESDGTGSFSRVSSALQSVACMAWITHFVIHSHALPDAMTLGGLATFATAPYASNKIAGAFTKE